MSNETKRNWKDAPLTGWRLNLALLAVAICMTAALGAGMWLVRNVVVAASHLSEPTP